MTQKTVLRSEKQKKQTFIFISYQPSFSTIHVIHKTKMLFSLALNIFSRWRVREKFSASHLLLNHMMGKFLTCSSLRVCLNLTRKVFQHNFQHIFQLIRRSLRLSGKKAQNLPSRFSKHQQNQHHYFFTSLLFLVFL